MSKEKNARFRRRQFNFLPLVGLILGIAGIILSFGGHWQQYNSFNWQGFKNDFYANAGTELISVSITIILIDTLNEYRQKRLLKDQLTRQLGSGDRSTSLQAVQELKAEGWFFDGSLQGARLFHSDWSQGQLHYANLEGADIRAANLREAELKGASLRNCRLQHSDLRGCYLKDADLTGANLKGVNLRGSDITLAQIQSALTLEGAIMPDGSYFEDWRNQPLPVTLPKREITTHFLTKWEEEPDLAQPNDHKILSSFLWASVGIVTAVFGQVLWRLTRNRKVAD